ncbi:MAG: hypothetical protein ACQEP8_04055, partial [Chlamydiota bacterium]
RMKMEAHSIYDLNTEVEHINDQYRRLDKQKPHEVNIAEVDNLIDKLEVCLGKAIHNITLNKLDNEELHERYQLIHIASHLGERILALRVKIAKAL